MRVEALSILAVLLVRIGWYFSRRLTQLKTFAELVVLVARIRSRHKSEGRKR